MKKLSNLFLMILLGLTVATFSQPRPDVRKLLTEAANYLQTGNFAEAEKILLEARKSAPTNADVHNLLGIIYDQKSDFAKAEISYRAAIRLNPKAVSPLANLGILLAKTKREKDAVQIFETVLKLNPEHPQTIINLGFIYSSLENFPKAAEFLQKANLIQPKSPDILFKLATALYQTKKFEAAKEIFGQLNPTSEIFYYLGLIAFEQNDYELAQSFFRQSLTLKPQFADANFMLGEIAAKQSNYPQAVNFYAQAVAQNKTRDVYFIRLGGTYLILKEVEKAFQIFKEAAEYFPRTPEIKYFWAVTARGLGNYDLAISEVRKALILRETADSNALLGAILADRDQAAEAQKYLRKAISLNQSHFNSNYDLGRLLVKEKKFAEALPFLQKAATLSPQTPDVHYQLFLIYSRLKRKAEADQEFKLFRQFSEKN